MTKSKKIPVGRPRIEEEIQTRRNIMLCDRLAEKAKMIGRGNISKGIREALKDYE